MAGARDHPGGRRPGRGDRVLEQRDLAWNRLHHRAYPAGKGIPRARRGPGHDRLAGRRPGWRARSGRPRRDLGHAGHGRRRTRGRGFGEPVLRPGRRPGQPRRADRLRDRRLRRAGSEPARSGRHPRHRPHRGRAGTRRAGRNRRAGGGERTAAVVRPQRGRRDRGRGRRAVHLVRVAAVHAAAPGSRDRRAGLRPDDRRAPLPRGEHSLGRPDAGHPDRAGRGDRLRAVHRHPAPQQPQGRDAPRGSRGPGTEHLGQGCPVRRHHGVHRPDRHARAAHQLHLRPRDRRRGHRAVHGRRRRHPAARAARLPRPAGPVPQGTPSAGRQRARAGARPAGGPGWPHSCSVTLPCWPPPRLP